MLRALAYVKSQAALHRVRLGRRILNATYLAVSAWVIVASVWQITRDTFALGDAAKGAATAETVGPACAKALGDYRAALEGAWDESHRASSDVDGLAARYRTALARGDGSRDAVAQTCRGTLRGARAELVLARLASGQLLAVERASAFALADLREAAAREIPTP